MATVKINVRLPWVPSGIRGPVSSNTLHFSNGAGEATPGTLDPLLDAVQDLYVNGLAGIWSSLLTGEGTISALDLADAEPRTAVDVREFTFTAGAAAVPTEPAINVGFRATNQTGVPRARARGRVHLGPLVLDAGTFTATGHLAGTTIAQVADAFEAMHDAAAGGAVNWTWVVGTETFGFRPVTLIEVGNEVSTLRSRQNTRTVIESRSV